MPLHTLNRSLGQTLRLQLLAVGLSLLVAALPTAAAQAGTPEDLQRVQAKLKQAQAALAQDSATASTAAAALADADHRLLQAEIALRSATTTRQVTEARLGAATDGLQAAEAELDQRKAIEALRVRSAYMDRPGAGLSALVLADSLPELLNRVVYLDRVAQSGNDALAALQLAEAQAAAAAAEAARARDAASSAEAELVERLADVSASRQVRAAAKKVFDRKVTEDRAEAQAYAAESVRITAQIRAQQRAMAARAAAVARAAAARAAVERAAADAARRRNEPSPAPPGGPVSATGLRWPVQCPITSPFGPRWGSFHPGLDLGCPMGTPVAAAKDGIVLSAGPAGGYGNFVVIDHGGNLVTAYAHNSPLLVRPGQVVRQGQVISLTGNTGFSTGPHLHFEVRIDANPRNPLDYLP